MKFFKQIKKGTCDIIAVEDVFSYLHKHNSYKEIKKNLHRHTFGTWLSEIGFYLEKNKIKTKLISNNSNINIKDKKFQKALKKYSKKGNFENKIPKYKDIKNKPIIINVDAFKIRKQKGGPGPHYVVVLKEKNKLYMYDGWDKNKKVKVTFPELKEYSKDISKFYGNGMWLFIE